MVATSKNIAQATPGVDLAIGFRYTPPAGEGRAGLAMLAWLATPGAPDVGADTIEFDPATGETLAIWQEATTRRLVPGLRLEARFVRERDGATRLLYVRPVMVR